MGLVTLLMAVMPIGTYACACDEANDWLDRTVDLLAFPAIWALVAFVIVARTWWQLLLFGILSPLVLALLAQDPDFFMPAVLMISVPSCLGFLLKRRHQRPGRA